MNFRGSTILIREVCHFLSSIIPSLQFPFYFPSCHPLTLTLTHPPQTNPLSSYFRSGLYPSPKPEILGREAEGIIVSVGPSTTLPSGLQPGDRVVYLGTSAYAEYTSTPASKIHRIPSSLAPGTAAAAMLQGLTALTMIREAYHVQPSDWILVHAAAGGVGLWLCQLLKAVGAKVIATASSEEKLQLARENGASFGIDYKTEDIVGRVMEITGAEGVHAVFDGVGKDTFEADMQVVRRKGTLVSFGNSVSDFDSNFPFFFGISPCHNFNPDQNHTVRLSPPLPNRTARSQEPQIAPSTTLWLYCHTRGTRSVYG